MFPFMGIAGLAQYVGEILPLTHYLRIVRAIMLKGATLQNVQYDTIALFALMVLRHGDCGDALPPHAGLTLRIMLKLTFGTDGTALRDHRRISPTAPGDSPETAFDDLELSSTIEASLRPAPR